MRCAHRRNAAPPDFHQVYERLRHGIAHAHHHHKHEDLQCGRKNNVPHDRHEQAVTACQMTERNAHIEEQRHARNAEDSQHEQLQFKQEFLTAVRQQIGQTGKSLPHLIHRQNHLIRKNEDADECRQTAQTNHHHRDNGFTEQMLRHRDRQGEHEVALTAEQVFVEPLDENDSRYHKCRHHHAHIQHGADGGQHEIQ